jgi:ribosomal protein S18 acetylase RimI-like enzyme
MEFSEIIYGTQKYDQAVKLRQEILRAPLDLDLHSEDLSSETKQLHFGIFSNDLIQACLVIVPVEDSLAKLRQMAVEPEQQRNGLGRKLILEVEEHLKSIGFKEIELNARTSAIGFYQKLGYEVIGEEFTEVKIPHLKMLKSI